MRLRTLLPFVLLSLPLASLPAAAQGSAEGAITIADLPPGPASLQAGQSMSVPFKVNVAASGFTCSSATKLVIDLAITNAGAAPLGVTPSVEPANLSLDVAVGSYQAGLPPPVPVQPLNASGTATLRITTRPDANGGNFAASVSASSKGELGMGCVPEMVTMRSDTKVHAVTITASASGNQSGGGPGGPGGPGNQTGGNQTSPPPPPPARSPGFETLAAAGAVAAVAVLARRKR